MAQKKPKSRGFLRYWFPVLLYIALIFTLSSTTGLQAPGDLPSVDKLAHVIEYGILGLLLARAFRGSDWVASRATAVWGAIVVGLFVGLSDELYQSGIPGRESDPADFASDAVGLALAAALFVVLERLSEEKEA